MKPSSLASSKWTWHAGTVFTTLFLVFCLLSIVESRWSSQLTWPGPASPSPANLKMAPALFSTRLAVESRDFPVDEMTKTKAWGELQTTLSAYSARLELLDDRNREIGEWTSYIYLLSACGFCAFAFVNRKRTPEPPVPPWDNI